MKIGTAVMKLTSLVVVALCLGQTSLAGAGEKTRIAVVAGTFRGDSNTLKVAQIAMRELEAAGAEVELIDLQELPDEAFNPAVAYSQNLESFRPMQDKLTRAKGILFVTPEYNGSMPGMLKHFIDVAKYPDSFKDKPISFVGLAAGQWGGKVAVEQLTVILEFQEAHVYGKRTFLPRINGLLNEDKSDIKDETVKGFLVAQMKGFERFTRLLCNSELLPL